MSGHEYETNFEHDSPTALGTLVSSSYLRYNPDFPDTPLRIMGNYCITLILDGQGHYRDANGYRGDLQPGHLILTFPDVAVRYCPPKGHTWYEVNVVFEGPLFELMRGTGILDPARPIITVSPLDEWHNRLRAIVCRECVTSADQLVQLADFSAFLVAIASTESSFVADESESGSIRKARHLLHHDVGFRISAPDAAGRVGLPYETFRKRFAQEVGLPPARFRSETRLAAAKELLATSTMNCKEISSTLGYASEFYFSRKFKKATGLSPTAYRSERLRLNPARQAASGVQQS